MDEYRSHARGPIHDKASTDGIYEQFGAVTVKALVNGGRVRETDVVEVGIAEYAGTIAYLRTRRRRWLADRQSS